MPRYLIELTHDSHHDACVRALGAIERFGGHFFTNAEWGCRDGVHSGWVIADLDSRNEALQIVPPESRQKARIVELSKFTREQIMAWVAELD